MRTVQRESTQVLQGQGAIPVSCPESLRTAGCGYPPVQLALFIPLIVAILIAYARFHCETSAVPDWGQLCQMRNSGQFPNMDVSLHKRYWEPNKSCLLDGSDRVGTSWKHSSSTTLPTLGELNFVKGAFPTSEKSMAGELYEFVEGLRLRRPPTKYTQGIECWRQGNTNKAQSGWLSLLAFHSLVMDYESQVHMYLRLLLTSSVPEYRGTPKKEQVELALQLLASLPDNSLDISQIFPVVGMLFYSGHKCRSSISRLILL